MREEKRFQSDRGSWFLNVRDGRYREFESYRASSHYLNCRGRTAALVLGKKNQNFTQHVPKEIGWSSKPAKTEIEAEKLKLRNR